MAGLVLSAPDRAHLRAMMRLQLNSTVHRRMNVLLLLDDGWAAERIAEALYIDAETVREYRRLYKSSGVTGLERLAYVGAEPDLTTEQRATLSAELEARLYMTSKEVCAFVAAKFGVEYTPNAMSKLLNRLGFVYKKPKRVPAKANAAAQQQFVEQTLAPLMAEAGAEKPLYFVDATHPAYTGHPACGWIKKGQTRELKSNHGRVNVTVNGALSWPEREVVRRGDDRVVRRSGGASSNGDGDPRGVGQRQLQPLQTDQGVPFAGWLSDRAGLPAALCTQPQSDRAAVVPDEEEGIVEPALPLPG